MLQYLGNNVYKVYFTTGKTLELSGDEIREFMDNFSVKPDKAIFDYRDTGYEPDYNWVADEESYNALMESVQDRLSEAYDDMEYALKQGYVVLDTEKLRSI